MARQLSNYLTGSFSCHFAILRKASSFSEMARVMLGITEQAVMSRKRRAVSFPVSLFTKDRIRSHWPDPYHQTGGRQRSRGDPICTLLGLGLGPASLKGRPCAEKECPRVAGGKVTKEPPRIGLTTAHPLQPHRAQAPRGLVRHAAATLLPATSERGTPPGFVPAQRIPPPAAWREVFFLFHCPLSPWKNERSDFAMQG